MTQTETLLVKNQQAFIFYNNERKKIAMELIPIEMKHLFYALPLLLHFNYPDLPGYVSDEDTPYGVQNFTIEKESLSNLKVLFPQHDIFTKKMFDHPDQYPDLIPSLCFIESVLLMGSIGSVAQTRESDFDYWICIDKKIFTTKALALLEKKLSLICRWVLKKSNMLMTCFIVDKNDARRDNFGSVDKESAGSSQGKLLKEEFYRTLILQAGKIPLWWITPVGSSDEQYNRYKKIISSSQTLNPDLFIDLGNITIISRKEFFGAALWQINKAMKSPFKSVLKMALLETFLDRSKEYDLLSNQIKQRVFDKCSKTKDCDPYAIMIDRIIHYNLEKNWLDNATLLKQCFYIKTEVKAIRSERFRESAGYKEGIMLNYVDEWKWNDHLIKKLNIFKDWSFENTLAFGQDVHGFLKNTYIRLSDSLKKEKAIEQMISDTDRTILGRKLFALYKKQPHKVSYLERAFDEGIRQEQLTFSARSTSKGTFVWNLNKGQLRSLTPNPDELKRTLLRASYNIVDLITWAIYNQVCEEKTFLYLTVNPSSVTLPEIQRLVKELISFFLPLDISSLKNENLLEDPKKTKFFLVVNLLSSSSAHEIKELTVVYTTSWGELYVEHFTTKKEVERVVIAYILENPPKGISDYSSYYTIFIPKTASSKKIFTTLNNKIKEQLRIASYRY